MEVPNLSNGVKYAALGLLALATYELILAPGGAGSSPWQDVTDVVDVVSTPTHTVSLIPRTWFTVFNPVPLISGIL